MSERAASAFERTGRLAFAGGVAGLGTFVVMTHDLGTVFQPVADWLPVPTAISVASGLVMLIGGLALIPKQTRPPAAIALTANFAVWLLLLNLPNTAGTPREIGNWEACGLNMTVVAGGWLLIASPWAVRRAGWAMRLFALGLPMVGLSHFIHAADAIVYVPAWFPARIGWVYFTGAAHILAGGALFFGVRRELAAVLEAIQISAFVFIAHLPAVWSAPTDGGQWAQLIYAVAIAGAAWGVAAKAATAS